MLVLISASDDRHLAGRENLPEHRPLVRYVETVIHQFLLGLPGEPPRLSRPPSFRAALVQQPRPAQRFAPLLPRTFLPAVDLAAVTSTADRDLPAASAAEEQSKALSCSLVDRPDAWPPSPLDFPTRRPYPQRVVRFWLLVLPGSTPSAESWYLSALTLFGGHHPSIGFGRSDRKLDSRALSPAFNSPHDLHSHTCHHQPSSAMSYGS